MFVNGQISADEKAEMKSMVLSSNNPKFTQELYRAERDNDWSRVREFLHKSPTSAQSKNIAQDFSEIHIHNNASSPLYDLMNPIGTSLAKSQQEQRARTGRKKVRTNGDITYHPTGNASPQRTPHMAVSDIVNSIEG